MFSYDSAGTVYQFDPGDRVILPKQLEAIEATHHNEFTLFGGAVGGGKSRWLRWVMIYWLLKWASMGFTDVRVGMFCDTFKELTQRQILPSRKEFPDWLGTFNKSDFTFTLHPEYGSGMIEYCNLDDPKKYLSNEWAAGAFEELTRIDKSTFLDVVGRIRWPGIEHSPMVGATNPGSRGHKWVYDMCINEATKIRAQYHEDLGIWSKPYGFIQALPRDNPLLPKSYWIKLKRLPVHLYNALVLGDWSVFEGQFFTIDGPAHIVPPFRIPESWPKFRSFDHGWRNPEVCLWGAIRPDDGTVFFYREYSVVGMTSNRHKPRIHEAGLKENNGFNYDEKYLISVGDPTMFKTDGSNDRNKTPAETYNNMDDEIGSFFMIPAVDNKNSRPGWDALRTMLDFEYEYYEEDGKREARIKRQPKIKIFNTCPNLISSLSNLVYKDGDKEVPAETNVDEPGTGDDEAVAARYFIMTCVRQSFSVDYEDDNDRYNPLRLAMREEDPMKGASVWATD